MARCLTIAVCQTGPIQRSATRAETVGRLVHLLEQAAAAGAEIAVFPEMALTTFFPRWRIDDQAEIDAFFESAMPGPETQRLYDAAARLKIGFALGYSRTCCSEDGRTRHFNTMDLVGPDGRFIGRYRKMHVPGSAEPEEGTPRIWSGAISSRAISASRSSTIAASASAWRSATTAAGRRPIACCASTAPRWR